jgi:acyl-CoA thioester hydrolase
MYFAGNGYPMGEFARLRLGPVGMKDELEYFSQVGLLDTIVVTMSVAGMSTDSSCCRLRQKVLRSDGQVCARLMSSGGWTDLAVCKLVAPPAALEADRRCGRRARSDRATWLTNRALSGRG